MYEVITLNKLLLIHELLNMVNKDKWAEIHYLVNYYYIYPLDHDSLENYQESIED